MEEVQKKTIDIMRCAGPERIFHFGRVCWSWKNISQNISLWEGVLVLKEVKNSLKSTITTNISLWEGVIVLKEVKFSKRCQLPNNKTPGLWRRFTKNKLTQWGSHIFMSILTSDMKVIKIGQKYFLWTFWGFLVSIICDIKIDVNMCEPHYSNFFLCEPPP